MTYVRTIPETAAQGELVDPYRRLAYPDGSADEAFKALSLDPALLAADAARRNNQHRRPPGPGGLRLWRSQSG